MIRLSAGRPRTALLKKKKASTASRPAGVSIAKLLLVMTVAATSGSLLFNFSTNSNYELLTDRLRSIMQDPAQIGVLVESAMSL